MINIKGNKTAALFSLSSFLAMFILVLPIVLASPNYLKPGKSAGGTLLSTGQREPCAGYPAPGAVPSLPSCLPVRVIVTNTEETKVIDSYCDPSGVIPCNKKEYTAKYFIFSCTAEAVGEIIYKKDFTEFSVNAQGTEAGTRILQLQGSHTWYTLEGVDAKKKWHTENFPKGRVNIRIPFKFSIYYPPSQDMTTNVCFDPMVIESQDESENWLLDTGTSQVCGNHPQIHFFVTPDMIKEFVAKKEFQKTFQWRDSQPGEKSTIDNFIDIKMQIGKAGPAPPVNPPPTEEKQYVPLAQYRKPADKSAKTPCDIIKQDLSEAKKLRDAFKDPTLLERAKKEDWDAQRYTQEVNKKVLGPSGKTAESPMWTDPTTCQIKIYWDKKKYKDKGFPEVSYEADLAHEKVHETNCKKRGNPLEYDADMSFPAKLSQEEVSAYEAKIKYLETWLKTNCK